MPSSTDSPRPPRARRKNGYRLAMAFVAAALMASQALHVFFIASSAPRDESDGSDSYVVQFGTSKTSGAENLQDASKKRGILASFPQANNTFAGRVWPSTTNVTNRAIFYNVFVPPPANGSGNAIRIVKEQLKQRSESVMKDAPVYYTHIGYPHIGIHVLEPNCHLLQHVPEGDEELTLQALYEYCVQFPKARVSYIHDKGSFHTNFGNEKRRRYVTKAAFSDVCVYMPPDMCNVCCFDVYVRPHLHTGANMWTADCSYIRKLVPPKDYDFKMREMYDSLQHCHDNFTCALTPNASDVENALGIGRFAMEHWVLSHPQAKPCDTHHPLYTTKKKGPRVDDWIPKLKRAPRQGKVKGWGIFKQNWFKMEGRLYEYDYHYGERPPKDSWFWRLYRNFTMEKR